MSTATATATDVSGMDETDVLEANARLTVDLATASTRATTAETSLATVRRELEAMTTRATTAEASLATSNASLATVTADRDRLAGIDRDFNSRLASEMAKHGVRREATAAAASSGKALTLTEQCMAAKAGKP